MTAITATVEGIAASANADTWLVHRGRFLDATFLLGVGDISYLVRIHRGRVEAIAKGPFVMPRATFSLKASEAAWRTFWQLPLFANLRYFKELLALPRPSAQTAAAGGVR